MEFDLYLVPISLWGSFGSLGNNKLGVESGKAIAEALEVNPSITNIK